MQLQLGQRAIVFREVVQGRPRILSLYAPRRAHGANVPGARRKRERECEFPRDLWNRVLTFSDSENSQSSAPYPLTEHNIPTFILIGVFELLSSNIYRI